MSKKTAQTSSFLVRFNQRIFENENGESDVQWRGKISHVQGGDQKSFTEFEEALNFMQDKLSGLTLDAIQDKSVEEKKGLLSKSFGIWKRAASSYPKLVIEAIKDPKAQVSQIQDQITNVSEEISQKMEFNEWRSASKNDYIEMMKMMNTMSKEISSLSKKLDKLTKKKK